LVVIDYCTGQILFLASPENNRPTCLRATCLPPQRGRQAHRQITQPKFLSGNQMGILSDLAN